MILINIQAIEIVCVIGPKVRNVVVRDPLEPPLVLELLLKAGFQLPLCVFSIPLNNDVCSLYTSDLRLLVYGHWVVMALCLVLIVSSLSRWVSPGACVYNYCCCVHIADRYLRHWN